jgi:hypothetical protein
MSKSHLVCTLKEQRLGSSTNRHALDELGVDPLDDDDGSGRLGRGLGHNGPEADASNIPQLALLVLQHIVAQGVDDDLQLGLLDLGDEGLEAARNRTCPNNQRKSDNKKIYNAL